MSMNEISTRDVLNRSLEAPEIDPVLLGIANRHIEGDTIQNIATQFNISEDRVAQVLDRREVKQYVDQVYLSQGFLNRFKRIQLINQVIEKKIQDVALGEEYTKKDLLEWLRLLQDMDKSARPQQKGPTVAVQVNNYDSLMQDLMEK
jgi:hypothetical protein